MDDIKIDLTNCTGFFNDKELIEELDRAKAAAKMLKTSNGKGSEFTGWVNLTKVIENSDLLRIKTAANKIQNQAEYLINIGIGGSYLGTKAIDDALDLSTTGTKLLYAGNNLSGTEMNKLISFIANKEVALCIVSKSGTTTEPAIAFRILKKILEEKYGKKASDRIYAITDKKRGAVKAISEREGFESFVIPNDIGGRYSVLSPVGLLPLASAGADIDELLKGASAEYSICRIEENPAIKYAAVRNLLYKKEFTTEIMAVYESSLRFFTEWWKQLFGESEGKENKGIFPASVVFSADLHSMGQYIQQGIRNIFETVIKIDEAVLDMTIPDTGNDEDGLNYLSGQNMNYVNKIAAKATVKAHVKGGVPNIILTLKKQDEYNLGRLIYFFEYACAVSGYMLGVNPFNQPGVEAYKNEMFKMLGKPGY